jgi:hypothetical protein
LLKFDIDKTKTTAMKTKIIQIFTATAFIALTSILYTGCKKEEDPKPQNASSAADNANAESAFAGIWKQISTVTDSSNALRSPAGCATASITPFDLVTWPKTVVINFGTTNCLGSDLNNRRGIITAVFSGPYLDSGTVITVTLTNYYHNDYQIQGTQVIKNKGNNAAGHLVYNVIVNSATITHPTNGQASTWNTNQDREFYAGYLTNFNIFDDVYLIRGSANGVSMEGESYTIVTNTDLRVNIGCHWIVSGNFTLTLGSYPTYPIVFDYGAGACDGDATATLDGTTYNISMY